VIIEKHDAKVVPLPFASRPTPEQSKLDIEDTKHQNGTPVASEENRSNISADKSEVPNAFQNKPVMKFPLPPPSLEQKTGKNYFSQIKCIPYIVAREGKKSQVIAKGGSSDKMFNEN